MLKTTVAAFITGAALLFIFRERLAGFPLSVFILSCVLNYIFLAVWHILIRRGFIDEVEVDLSASAENATAEDTGSESSVSGARGCCSCNSAARAISSDTSETKQKDGFLTFIKAPFAPSSFAASIANYGAGFFNSSIVLFIVTWWMILVYMCFMPEYMRFFFRNTPVAIGQIAGNYYISNLRVFAGLAFFCYPIFVLFNSIILKIRDYKSIKNYIAGAFYAFGWNLILYLILIISGNFIFNKTGIIVFIIAIIVWLLAINTCLFRKLTDFSAAKSIGFNLISIIATGILSVAILFSLYKS